MSPLQYLRHVAPNNGAMTLLRTSLSPLNVFGAPLPLEEGTLFKSHLGGLGGGDIPRLASGFKLQPSRDSLRRALAVTPSALAHRHHFPGERLGTSEKSPPMLWLRATIAIILGWAAPELDAFATHGVLGIHKTVWAFGGHDWCHGLSVHVVAEH